MVRTAIAITNNGTTGGAGGAGPRWGVRGTAGPTDHPEEFTGELSSVTDALDEAVYPVNLYEAQLRHRLRGTTQERGECAGQRGRPSR